MSATRAACFRAVCFGLSVAFVIWLAPAGSTRAAIVYSYEAHPQLASDSSHRAAVTHHPSRARSGARSLTGASSTAQPMSHARSGKRAPNGPPLSSPGSLGEGEQTAGVPSAKGDQLTENGLSSPLCKGSMGGGLSRAAQSNCQTSGFVGAPAPTNNYAIDVHIDIGALGFSKGGLLSVIQDVFIAPVWNAVVWVVHALVVTLEWCYTLELLRGSTMSGVASALRRAQVSFTAPWLTLVLAVASILAAYNGLIRRRVTETLGQALVTIAMMVAGLWVIADPVGTVGAVGQWANQASLGTLGAVAQGTPSNAPRTLGDSMRALFGGAIEMPWCYLEFGNVSWCSDPAQLDPRLHKAALRIVADQQALIGCRPSLERPFCVPTGSVAELTIAHTDQLLRQADTNGKLFLAFPANDPERNSIKEKGSLLHVLCQTEDDTKCTGPTAAEAEFRSDSGTFPRMIGVVLIAAGVLGMVMLFGLIALHLLIAAVVSLFMLLLAPFAVLAPAFGDRGRAVFGGWLTRLLGAVTSKLLFSFLLGALLTTQRILVSLPLLGWWTQWLLISACWWALFLKRHQVIASVQSGGRAQVRREHRPLVQRLGGALQAYSGMRHPVRWARARISSQLAPPPPPADKQLRKRPRGGGSTGGERPDPKTKRSAKHARGEVGARAHASPRLQARTSAKRAQLERVRDASEAALASGDRRRAAKLAVRGQRIETELARQESHLDDPRHAGASSEDAQPRTDSTRERRQSADQRDALAGFECGGDRKRRDYAALAGLAGYGREQYARLDPRGRREVHGRIDRELALRAAAKESAYVSAPALAYVKLGRSDRELDPVREQRPRPSGSPPPGSPAERSAPDPGPRDLPVARKSAGARERRSTVMDDAREVAARRKRQLGREPIP